MTIIDVYGQNQKIIDLQIQWYEKGNIALKENELRKAYSAYYFSYDYFPESELGKVSFSKYDSIQKILRKNLIEKMQGFWKVKRYKNPNFSPGDIEHFNENLPGKYLEIKNDSLKYFDKRKHRNKKVRPIKITFCDYQNYFPAFSHIVHNNQLIWAYWVDETKQKLSVTRAGQLLQNNQRTGPSSHPSGYTYLRLK